VRSPAVAVAALTADSDFAVGRLQNRTLAAGRSPGFITGRPWRAVATLTAHADFATGRRVARDRYAAHTPKAETFGCHGEAFPPSDSHPHVLRIRLEANERR
jgi:hypothetical protein